MIDALIAGKLYGQPTQRTASNGRPYATGKLRVATDGDALFVNVIAFAEQAAGSLLALEDGEAVALAGTLTPKAYTDKQGEARPSVDMVAHRVLTAYHVTRKRQAVSDQRPKEPAAQPADWNDTPPPGWGE